MKRKDILEHFYKTYVQPKSLLQLQKLDAYIKEHKEELAVDLILSLDKISKKAQEMQTAGTKNNIQYIVYQVLRSEITNGGSTCAIRVYDASWYMDNQQCKTTYDASWALKYLHNFEQDISQEAKRYVNQVFAGDIDIWKQKELEKYIAYIAKLAKYAFSTQHLPDNFDAIKKEEELYIHVGEYKDKSEVVHQHHTTKKEAEVLIEALQEDRKEYMYECYRQLSIEDVDLRQKNFCYADFSHSKLLQDDYRGCTLLGANFKEASIENSDFSYSLLQESNFTDAQIFNVNLRNICAKIESPSSEYWYSPGLTGMNFTKSHLFHVGFQDATIPEATFQEAQLTEVNFTNADLTNANFEGANFTHVDFTGARMEGTVFPEKAPL